MKVEILYLTYKESLHSVMYIYIYRCVYQELVNIPDKADLVLVVYLDT
jgi:hypothetical protein